MPVDYASVLEVDAKQTMETYVAGAAAPQQRRLRIPRTHVHGTTRPLLRLYGGVSAIVRFLARALMAFPVVLVLKAILRFASVEWGDYITIFFVGLVLAFFASLSALMFLMALVGPRSKRERLATVVFEPPRLEDVPRLAARALPPAAVRVTGRLDAGLEPGAPVLVERWAKRDGRLVRLFEGCSFVVASERGAPAGVELASGPTLLVAYEAPTGAPLDVAGRLVAGRPGELEPIAEAILRQGDLVEIAAPTSEPAVRALDPRVSQLFGASGGAPYRAAESAGILLRGDVVIRRA